MLLLTLPDGIFLKHCAPHLTGASICNLASTCHEARKQSPEWKKAFMAVDKLTIPVESAQSVWQCYYCTPMHQTEAETKDLLTVIMCTFTTNEVKRRIKDEEIEEGDYIEEALKESNLMSTRIGRTRLTRFIAEASKSIKQTVREEEGGEETQAKYLVPLVMYKALTLMACFIAETLGMEDV